jgi:tRNA threonylcarbamoyladenosine biosynthesis protein TsaE
MPSPPYKTRFTLASRDRLNQIAAKLADWLRPGDVVALNGTLGAGKTTLTQAIGHALDVTETISSPTFVLMNEYRTGRYPITHVDLYRLGEAQAHSLAEELFSIMDEGRSLVLVEWACYGAFLDEVITVSIQIDLVQGDAGPDAGDEARMIAISANRPLWTEEAAS